jgi:hypothetical protein
MKILVDGEVVEKVNERLLAQRRASEAKIDSWGLKMASAPKWWPAQGDELHQSRMRACEKILLDEWMRVGASGNRHT